MPLRHREEGDYELFLTTNQNRILVLDGKKWAAWVEGQAGEILVETDEQHQKERTLEKGKFMMLDFEEDPTFKDMPHLFLEKNGAYREVMLPQGWPDAQNRQKKIINTEHEIAKDDLEDYISGDMPRGEGEKRMKRPGGGAISNVAYHLKGFDFPGRPGKLIAHARDKGAPDEVIDKLETLHDREYTNPADVTQEIGEQAEELPIEGYRKAAAREIAEQVHDLSGHDLEIVEAHERAHKSRKTVLMAIEAAKMPDLPERYDLMAADEIIDMLDDCSDKQLAAMERFEKEHTNRQQVLEAIGEQRRQ